MQLLSTVYIDEGFSVPELSSEIVGGIPYAHASHLQDTTLHVPVQELRTIGGGVSVKTAESGQE
jgi:hypothetical protein